MQYGMYSGVPMEPYSPQPSQQIGMQPQYQVGYQQQPMQQYPQQRPMVDPRKFETPEITIDQSKPLFPTLASNTNDVVTVPVDNLPVEQEKKRRGRPRKEETSVIIKANEPEKVTGTIEDQATIYSYGETTMLLHDTLGQIDAINSELVQEFNNVRVSRTMKNKYNVLVGLSENIGSMIGNRLNTIKEINNCISKSNEMDYKKYKDMKAAQATMDDDKYISDLYQAFMHNNQNQAPQLVMPPMQNDPSIVGNNIVRANITQSDLSSSNPIDVGYLNYVTNLTPEQNLMRYENNPNVKQVVVYDAASGARSFQIMDISTGEVINNVPVYDNMIMEDTTIDIKNKIAKNLNLNESFPVIVINDNITSQY